MSAAASRSKVTGLMINELTLPAMLSLLCHPLFRVGLELETPLYGGRLAPEEIEGSVRRFLSNILRFWVGQGWLDGEAFVAVTVKSKSRPTPKGSKVSLHLGLQGQGATEPHILATKEMHDLPQEDSEFLHAPDSDPTGRRRVDLLTRAMELAGPGAPPEYVPTDWSFWRRTMIQLRYHDDSRSVEIIELRGSDDGPAQRAPQSRACFNLKSV